MRVRAKFEVQVAVHLPLASLVILDTMMVLCRYGTLLCTVGLLSGMAGAAEIENAKENNVHQVPLFSASSLMTGSRSEDLASVLSTTGLIAVQLDDSTFQRARKTALDGLCRCANSPAFLDVGGTDTAALLSDNFTTRTTFATATVGNTPLALPQETLTSACGIDTVESMELLRDFVAQASSAFVTALDRLLLPGETPLMRTIHGASYSTVSSIVKASKNLEHFHLYSKQNTTTDTKVLDLHTDAGLFLTFVPGRSCQNGGDESTHFYIQSEKKLQRVEFPPNSIGIMLGAGAQHWLDSTLLNLQATRHAVHMQPGEERAWYGMMSLVPQSTIVQQDPQRTFADMQRAMGKAASIGDNVDVSIGCGNLDPSEDHGEDSPIATKHRRRLQHITDGSTCNNVTNFFCWMTCQVSNAEETTICKY